MKKDLHYAYGPHIKKIFFILSLITSFSYTKPKQNRFQPKIVRKKISTSKKEIWVTIFVHGIMSVQPHLNPNNLAKVISDKVEGSAYYDSVCHMRNDKFFFKNQAMQEIGLHPINPNLLVSGNASGAIAQLFSASTERTGKSTKGDLYYTFGWCGVISPKIRLKAGVQLCCELAKELNKLRCKGLIPRVRVVGYSHGGNVALNMATVAKRYKESLPQVDELILMGVPLQPENDYLVASPLFKQVYNLFSKSDYIQPLDCFSSMCLFSKRKFTARKNLTIPKKVIQIQVRITKSMQQNRNCNQNNLHCMSDIVAKGNARFQRSRSPGHVELWFFGWTPKHYRNTFLFYPLPILAIVPQIIHSAKLYSENQNVCREETIIADLRPDDSLMILRKARDCKVFAFVPFLSNADINALARSIEPFKPKVFTKKMYDNHTNNAISRAKQSRCRR